MSDAYLQLWSQPQLEIQRRSAAGDEFLSHTANDQFERAGVSVGDRVYVVGTKDGQLLLIGRLTVEKSLTQAEADSHFGHDVYEAKHHLIGEGTALDADREVPEEIARKITRESGKPITVSGLGLLATGRITDASADLFDSLL